MKKIIRIQAVCPQFEIDEQILESKAVKRLKNIRNNFIKYRRLKTDTLNVITSVVNPSLL